MIPYRIRAKASEAYSTIRHRLFGNKGIFDDVYRNHLWPLGNNQPDGLFSGSGSLPENTIRYEALVVEYITSNGIRKIVDLGCGDFQVASRILAACPKHVEYTGVDASNIIIERNQRLFGSDRISFVCRDAARDDLPDGELLLCKEVLQHLSNHDIKRALVKIQQFPRALITNGVHPEPTEINVDISSGSAARSNMRSGLWLDRPPFDLKGREIERYSHEHLELELIVFEWKASE